MDFLLRRGASDEHTLQGSVRNEQRRLSEKDMPPRGLHRFWVLDFVAPRSQPAAGMLPRRASPEPKSTQQMYRYLRDTTLGNHFNRSLRSLSFGETRFVF